MIEKNPLNLDTHYTDPKQRSEFIKFYEVATRLFRIVGEKEFRKIHRKLLKQSGRNNPQFHGFDSVLNPHNYTGIEL